MAESNQSKIVILGGGGMVGRAVINALSKQGLICDVLVRRPARYRDYRLYSGVRVRPLASLEDSAFLAKAFQGADAVINLLADLTAGPEAVEEDALVSATQQIKKAVETAKVPRVVALSHLGADAGNARDNWLYQLGEADAVTHTITQAQTTVLRAGLLLGPNDEVSSCYQAQLKRMPLLPVYQAGLAVQPLSVQDFAAALVKVMTHPADFEKKVTVVGPEEMTLKDVAQTVADLMGREHAVLLPMCRLNARLMASLGELAPIRSASHFQLKTLRADKTADTVFASQFGFAPQSIEQTLAGLVAPSQMRERYPAYRQEAGRDGSV
ncbi:SDR family oxidoreductase [Thiomicrospira sp. WB1]|uniref:SDR family oxidoreductase n=1 Tax=Thiomicrospira sp. WB1 TaxID=1685380 RepID=UPI0007467EAF|nr:NAD(P)H-binding protein [Thiomicrospira sp. WB1]KUJ71171.1 NAD-dependent dehydratase [Thiomicrospira sp. WB1]